MDHCGPTLGVFFKKNRLRPCFFFIRKSFFSAETVVVLKKRPIIFISSLNFLDGRQAGRQGQEGGPGRRLQEHRVQVQGVVREGV